MHAQIGIDISAPRDEVMRVRVAVRKSSGKFKIRSLKIEGCGTRPLATKRNTNLSSERPLALGEEAVVDFMSTASSGSQQL
jgi:hypothetical protein